MKHSPLSRFELLLRRLVEEPFAWFAGDAPDAAGLAAYLWQLLSAMPAADRAFDHFTVYLSPEQYAAIAHRADDVAAQVDEHLVFLAESSGQAVRSLPTVVFQPDAGLGGRRIRVAGTSDDEPSQPVTQVFSQDGSESNLEAIRAADAFLIVQGRQHIALDRPVTRIGRRIDNDLVLDSSAVSRQHAQIRWRQPYFVLYNVSSHGRTMVNGDPVQEHVLRPGDVIALSDVLLVYGEGRETPAASVGIYEDGDTLLKPPE